MNGCRAWRVEIRNAHEIGVVVKTDGSNRPPAENKNQTKWVPRVPVDAEQSVKRSRPTTPCRRRAGRGREDRWGVADPFP